MDNNNNKRVSFLFLFFLFCLVCVSMESIRAVVEKVKSIICNVVLELRVKYYLG